MPKYSIIVPIYNVEEYIEKSLTTIKEQSFQDFEVLMVDDCGTDNSVSIAQKFVDNDNRFKLLHHEHNKGVAAARNTALDVAQGEWLIFIDSDDWAEVDLLEHIDKFTSINEFDMLWYNVFQYYNSTQKSEIFWVNEDEATKNDEAVVLKVLPTTILNYMGCLWDKAFRHSTIKKLHLRFPEGVITEDSAFTFEYLTQCRLILRIAKPLYNYRREREGSYVTEDKSGARIKDEFAVFMHIYNFCNEHKIFNKFKYPLLKELANDTAKISYLKEQHDVILNLATETFKQVGFPEQFKDLDSENLRIYMEKDY